MPDKEMKQLIEKLEKLSGDLGKRTRQFHETGGFTDIRRSFVNEIEKKNDALRARIDQTVKDKDSWGFFRASLWRDFEAAAEDFAELVALPDTEPKKKR